MANPDRERYGRDESERNPNLDPDPELTPDPDLGPEGLKPGHTPPDSNSATASVPNVPPTKAPRPKPIFIVAIVAVVLFVGLIFIGYIAGLLA